MELSEKKCNILEPAKSSEIEEDDEGDDFDEEDDGPGHVENGEDALLHCHYYCLLPTIL